MKKIYSILALLAILCSCSNDLGEILEEKTTQQHTCRLYMNGGISGYADEPQSRASVTVQNGTVMYLTFPNDVKGQAVYNNGSWTVSYSGTITSGKCSAYCFPGSTAASGNTVSLNNVPGYGTTDGTCTVAANGDITLQANLKPLYPRLRFKGASGTKVKSNSMVTVVTGFSVSTAAMTSTKLDYSDIVGSSGYTDYVYYMYPASPVLILEIFETKNTGIQYGTKYTGIQYIPTETSSYAIVLPTQKSHNGWTMEDLGIVPEYNGHDYVELGLPSGLKWATCNIGANTPEDYGDYYGWHETEIKNDYSWSTYNPKDDVAHVKWGGSWRMPTEDEYDELCKNCTSEWIILNGIGGKRFKSNMNGNSIFLPAAGYRLGISHYDKGSYGYYWTSDEGPSVSHNQEVKYSRRIYFDSDKFYVSNCDRDYGLNVRPVSP